MKHIGWVLACSVALLVAGCGNPGPQAVTGDQLKNVEAKKPDQVQPEGKEKHPLKEDDHDHDHDHEDGDHDHDHEHHAHTAKYGGALVEVGDHVGQVEFVLAKDTGKLVVYIMDGHAENPVRVAWPAFNFDVTVGGAAPVSVSATPVANPLTGETVGDTSQYEATVEALKGAEAFDVTIPPFEFRGVQIDAISFKYPEGKQ